MEKLYYRLRTRDRSKWYMPTIRGKHNIKVYRRAHDAQDAAIKLRDRYKRLRQAEAKCRAERQASGAPEQ